MLSIAFALLLGMGGVIAVNGTVGEAKSAGEQLRDKQAFFRADGSAQLCLGGLRNRVNTQLPQALTGVPITVFGDGSQTRSFQYISDLVAGLWQLMERGNSDPVNIGNPHEMTLLALAQRIIRLADSRSEIVFRPLPEDDPKVRQPDIGRARTRLGWEPRVDTDEGLRLTLEWFRQKVGR